MRLLISIAMLLIGTYSAWGASSPLCNKVFDNQLSFSGPKQSRNIDEISLVTWNAYKFSKPHFMNDLSSLSKTTDIFFIQEAMHSDAIQNAFMNSLPFEFSFFKSFCDSNKQATGVMTAARYSLEKNTTLVSPDTEPFTHTPKVAGYSVLIIPEIGSIHLINTHALNFNSGEKFNAQISQLTNFIKNLNGPVIWAGDFNTWNKSRLKFLNEKASSVGLQHLSLDNDNRMLVLDHVYVRGLEVIQARLLTHINSSDHKPIEVIFKKK